MNKKKLLIFASIATLFGFYLAKKTPQNEQHGLSSIKNQEVVSDAKNKKKVETIKKQDPNVAYSNEVNKKISSGAYSNRQTMPLLLQTDARWANVAYGIGNEEGNTLGINGCAIVSLAMVSSFLDQTNVLPEEILKWSENRYFLESEGTMWSIFYDYAEMKEYNYEDLGNDISLVEEQLQQGHPVIISVKPGYFTETGHIMVMTGTQDGKFWLNDPNDSKEKNHSNQLYTVEQLESEALNFWSLYK